MHKYTGTDHPPLEHQEWDILDRPPCPGRVSEFQWDSKNSRWRKRSEANKQQKQDRYRLHVGKKVMDDYTLYLRIQMRSMMYPDYDLTRADMEARNENWFRWVEYHNAQEVAFAALVDSIRKPCDAKSDLENVVAQNAIANIPEISSKADYIAIELPMKVHPSEKLNYFIDEVVKVNGERVQKVILYSEKKREQDMERELAKESESHTLSMRDKRCVYDCTSVFLCTDVVGTFRPATHTECYVVNNRRHSKFCEVPSLVNEIVARRDSSYAKLLNIQAMGMPCDCLKYFRQTPSTSIQCQLKILKRPVRTRTTRYSIFSRLREKALQSFDHHDDPVFWLRVLMILRGLTDEGNVGREIGIDVSPGGRQAPKQPKTG